MITRSNEKERTDAKKKEIIPFSLKQILTNYFSYVIIII